MSTYDPGNGSDIEPVTSQPEYPDFDAKRLTVGEMLTVYTSVLIELHRRGLIRTNNAPIGDLAEYACALYYDGRLAPNSEKSYELTAADGRRIQVKVRATHGTMSPSSVFSALRSVDFDACVFIIADVRTNRVLTAYEWSSDEIRSLGRFQSHTNSTLIRTGQVQAGITGIDVTAGLDSAWQKMLALTSESADAEGPLTAG
jgi:hypothetical protein